MCNCTSCSQVYELPQSHYGDNWEVTLFWWFHINITFVKLLQEMSALDHLYWSPYLNTSYIVMSYKKVIDNWEGLVFHDFIYIYIYIYIYPYLSSMRFEHFKCCGLLLTTYVYMNTFFYLQVFVFLDFAISSLLVIGIANIM